MKADYFNIAFKNLLHRKLRSFLTLIGIIIGIAAIVGLISIGSGLNNAIEEQFEKMGSNRIFVMPFGGAMPGTGDSLTTEDVETLEKMSDFDYVTPYLMESLVVEYNKERYNYVVLGFPSEDAEGRLEGMDISLEEGRYFTANEQNVVMLGYKIALDGFDKEIHINNNVIINGTKMKVIGIFEEIGNSEDDNLVYIPMDRAQELFSAKDKVSIIDLVVKEGKDLDEVVAKVEKTLKKKRGDENFDVVTPEQILAQMGDIMLIVQVVLVGIAAISLIVGGIGIMNSMYTSVVERIKEIGIMKSVGAKNSDILYIFIIESGMLGLVGGIFGVIIGSTIAKVIGFAAAQSGFSLLLIKINPFLVLFGIMFAFIVGMVAGALPAVRAAKLKPVEALRS